MDNTGTNEHGKHHGNIHDEPPGHSFINTKTEVLNYEHPECDFIVKNEVLLGNKYRKQVKALKLIGFIFLGILTSLAAALILYIHEELAIYKYKLLTMVFSKYHVISVPVALTWYGGVLIPAMIGCLLVVFLEPKAAGGGVAGIIGFVNGVDTSATLTMKILLVKSASVICCITAGLAGGMEGPMVHIAGIIGAALPSFHIGKTEPFKILRTDPSKRDLVSGGIACGIAAAFYAPIGGLVMSIEEGMLYWNLTLIFQILVAALITHIILTSIMSIIFGCAGCLSAKSFLFFSIIKETMFSHQVHYMLIYCVEAAFFGFFGAFWNMWQTKLIITRKKYIKKKWHQILELFIVALVTATSGWLMLILFRKNCVEEPHHVEGFHFGALQMECEEGKITGIGTLLSHTQGNALRFIFYDSDYFDIPTLVVFGVVYFILSFVTMGVFISAGIFIPNLLTGCIWGRLIGEVLKQTVFSNDKNFRPSLLAIIGATCQLCGVLRIPFTLSVMMVESSGNTSFLFPIFITQIISTIVGNIFNHSIYHTQCFLGGQPIAETEPPLFCTDIKISSLITGPITSLTRKIDVNNIFQVLKSTKFNMYPVLQGKKLEGSILRYQLLKILKYRLYEKEDLNKLLHQYIVKERLPLTIDSLKEEDFQMTSSVDLSPFMNKSPHTLLENSSLNNAYNLMAFLGTRHIIVINKNNEALGVLSRKDVLFLREHCSMCGVHVVRLPRT